MGYCQLSYITKLEKKNPAAKVPYYKQALQTLYLPKVVNAITTRLLMQNNFTLSLQDMSWVHVIHVLGMLKGGGKRYVMCYMAYYESIDSLTQSESALHHPLDASNPSTIDDENLPSINKTKHSKKKHRRRRSCYGGLF